MSKVTHACNLRTSQVKERGLRVQGQSELGNREERWEESGRNENHIKTHVYIYILIIHITTLL